MESYKTKYEEAMEENDELNERLKALEKQILEGSSQSDKLNIMIEDHNKEMKTQHTKLLFALNDKDVLQNNLYLKEQQITDMAKLIEKLTNENKAKDEELHKSGHELQLLVDELRHQLQLTKKSLSEKTSDLFSFKVLTKMLHDGNTRRDRKVTNAQMKLSKLTEEYKIALKQLNVAEEACTLYTNLFLKQTYSQSSLQIQFNELMEKHKYLTSK